MGFWSVLYPIAATNLITNPSAEIDVTGYTAMAGSVARTTARRRYGIASVLCTTTTGVNDGMYYGPISLVSGHTYTLSVDVYANNGVPLKIYFATTGAVQKGTALQATATGFWRRYTVTWTADATASFRIYITKDNNAAIQGIYVDGLQLEESDYQTTYIDGDQPDCLWNGATHASTSVRSAQSRQGGYWYNLDTFGFFVKESIGIGMTDISLGLSEQLSRPGAFYRGLSVPARTFILSGEIVGASRTDLHGKRRTLLDMLKPDEVVGAPPVRLLYSGANPNADTYIDALYQDGLNFGALDGFSEKVAVRFIATDPFFYGMGNDGLPLNAYTSLTSVQYVLGRVDDTWQKLGTGIAGSNHVITAMLMGVDRNLYAGGSFTSAGGNTNCQNIGRWDGAAWNNLGTGLDGACNALAKAPDGSLYVGGNFLTGNGVTVNKVAKWTGSTFAALGAGVSTSGGISAIAFGLDGTLYAGGTFTTAGSVAAANIAKWDGSAWSTMGSGIPATSVMCMAVGHDGAVYVGGQFTTAGGVTCNNVAKWNGSAWSALGSGMTYGGTAQVMTMAVAPDGSLYVGGQFSTAGGVAAANVARWDGSSWEQVGSGFDGVVYDLLFDASGLLYAVGAFNVAGTTPARGVAVWAGSDWLHADLQMPGTTPTGRAIAIDEKGDIYLSFSDTAGTAYISALTTVVYGGSRETYPIFTIKRTDGTYAKLYWIKNETTGATLWLNYILNVGETLTIDLRPGRRGIVSSMFGDVTGRALLRNSNLATFTLLSGVVGNKISVFVYSDGAPTVDCRWQNVYWSADGVAV